MDWYIDPGCKDKTYRNLVKRACQTKTSLSAEKQTIDSDDIHVPKFRTSFVVQAFYSLTDIYLRVPYTHICLHDKTMDGSF